jgi:hypothetical protein
MPPLPFCARQNHKRVHRAYREAGLTIGRHKRKHCRRMGKPLVLRTAANREWAPDFAELSSRYPFTLCYQND